MPSAKWSKDAAANNHEAHITPDGPVDHGPTDHDPAVTSDLTPSPRTPSPPSPTTSIIG
jgi:hypothetical protein